MLRSSLAQALMIAIFVGGACGTHDSTTDERPGDRQATRATADGPRDRDELAAFAPTTGSLAATYLAHEADSRERIERYELTRDAKRVIEATLVLALTDDHQALLHLAVPDATFGLPDRAKRGARPLDQKWVGDFSAGLRRAADRFAQRTPFRCAVLSPAASGYVASGAEPMWCYYAQPDNTEHLVFELVMRDGRARVQYVGFFTDSPSQRLVVAEADVPPDHPPLKRRNLEITRRNIPAADPRLQQLRRQQAQAAAAPTTTPPADPTVDPGS